MPQGCTLSDNFITLRAVTIRSGSWLYLIQSQYSGTGPNRTSTTPGRVATRLIPVSPVHEVDCLPLYPLTPTPTPLHPDGEAWDFEVDRLPLYPPNGDAQITHSVILIDSMNLLQKVESAMGCPDRRTAMHSLRLRRLLWIYCPGHAGVCGNERTYRLVSKADITSGLQLDRAEVLRGLRNFLKTDKPEHHSIDRLKERGVEKRSGRHSTLQGRERSVFNQANIGTVSRATLGRLLRDGAERVWAFPSVTMPS